MTNTVADEFYVYGVLMVKNEETSVLRTLNSMVSHVSAIVVLDTGSTDHTLDICRAFATQQGLPVHIKVVEPFVNFEQSRNHMLDYVYAQPRPAKAKHVYALILDSNDELCVPGSTLATILATAVTKDGVRVNPHAYYVQQQWYVGTNITKYFNTRLINLAYKWRYTGVVHEYLHCSADKVQIATLPESMVCIRQDRSVDHEKSQRRFGRDEELLSAELARKPDDTRTMFYLAQTYECLGRWRDAYNLYQTRYSIKDTGFFEERFVSVFRMARLVMAHGLGLDDTGVNSDESKRCAVTLYGKALELDMRAEPLVNTALIYIDKQQYEMAYLYASMACELDTYPHGRVLFVNTEVYDYTRWHVLGRCAWYVREKIPAALTTGLKACDMAIKSQNKEVDINNRKFYAST